MPVWLPTLAGDLSLLQNIALSIFHRRIDVTLVTVRCDKVLWHVFPYVGLPKEEKTRGFKLLAFSFPCNGRAIPFWFVVFVIPFPKGRSRNPVHLAVFSQVEDLWGGKLLVLDREFSYSWFLSQLKEAGTHFTLCLNTNRYPTFTEVDGRKRRLPLSP